MTGAIVVGVELVDVVDVELPDVVVVACVVVVETGLATVKVVPVIS